MVICSCFFYFLEINLGDLSVINGSVTVALTLFFPMFPFDQKGTLGRKGLTSSVGAFVGVVTMF